MKIGTSLSELAQRIEKQAASKVDYAMDTRNLALTDDTNLAFTVKGEERRVKPTRLCLDQIGERVGIPQKYLDRMKQQAPALLASNVNHWFGHNPEVRMLRTLQNGTREARAFLSNKYRPLDNYDLMESVLPNLLAGGCEIKSAELTETRLYIQAVTPKLESVIKSRAAEGTQHVIGEVNDIVQAGVIISNSEVGCGSIRVEPMIYRLVCKNGAIMSTALKRHHVGRAGEGDWGQGDAFEVFSDATRKLDDRAFWAKVNDVVKASMSEIEFAKNVEKINRAARVDIGDPIVATEIIGKHFNLAETERKGILGHLARGGDLSAWGAANAVTRLAHDVESYDRCVELERFGGEIIELDKTFFN